MKIAGLALLVLIFGGTIFSRAGDCAGIFIDVPSLIIVVGGMTAVLLMSHSAGTLSLFFRFLTFQSKSFEDKDRLDLSLFFHTARRSVLAMGVLSYIMGLIITLMNLADPSSIGHVIAVSLIAIFYSIIISEMIITPMNRILMDKIPPKNQVKMSPISLLFPLVVILAVTAQFLIAILSIK